MGAPEKYNGSYVVIGIVFFVLIFAIGVELIFKSHCIYQDSNNITNRVLATYDTAKTKPVIPAPSYASIKDGYTEALLFFILALGTLLIVLLSPRIQNFSLGTNGVNITLKDVQQTLETVQQKAEEVQKNIDGLHDKVNIISMKLNGK